MTILGIPVFALLGLVLIMMIVFQILSGRRIIRANMKYHRYNGHAIVILAAGKLLLWVLVEAL